MYCEKYLPWSEHMATPHIFLTLATWMTEAFLTSVPGSDLDLGQIALICQMIWTTAHPLHQISNALFPGN